VGKAVLMKSSGAIVSSNYGIDNFPQNSKLVLSATPSSIVLGNDTDNWGPSWTFSDIRDPEFGFGLECVLYNGSDPNKCFAFHVDICDC